ncbi:phosphoribosyltransferase family protein [Acinetobacter sp. ANC 4862]|uniref:ComF family protein n=1 Tax=Acinetobacter sp. ANC 4862 TaxID=2529849 RepID=UPI00148EDD57|nr:phosphoribosyltransferase family protein [Acinetobacter sp. ANC 4862]
MRTLGIDRQQHHSLCEDCWQQLPWSKSTVQRQEMDIQVACHYDYPIDRIIQKFKYEQQLHFQNLLASTLLELRPPKIQAIVPMPISNERLVERGYNQSLVLAKIMAKALNIPVWQPVTRLQQHSQKGLNRLERIENIEQQFQINTTSKLRYRRVLILDDVVTTGSSIYALKQKLEELDCQKIYAACVASAEI